VRPTEVKKEAKKMMKKNGAANLATKPRWNPGPDNGQCDQEGETQDFYGWLSEGGARSMCETKKVPVLAEKALSSAEILWV
tara:strand:+ start:436 stop:678 length:243 start_codon:yes stop_codon:yes gene_type:complete